jgi:ribosomal protein L40E
MCGTFPVLDKGFLIETIQEYGRRNGVFLKKGICKRILKDFKSKYDRLPNFEESWKLAEIAVDQMSEGKKISVSERLEKKKEKKKAKEERKEERKKEIERKRAGKPEKEAERTEKVKVVICPECGNKNPIDSRFCLECGNQLRGKPPSKPKEPSKPEKPSKPVEPPQPERPELVGKNIEIQLLSEIVGKYADEPSALVKVERRMNKLLRANPEEKVNIALNFGAGDIPGVRQLLELPENHQLNIEEVTRKYTWEELKNKTLLDLCDIDMLRIFCVGGSPSR